MKIYVTGATGVLGRRVVRLLAAHGHQVTALARTADKARLVEADGAAADRTSLFDAEGLATAFAGHDVVCNLATSIPPVPRAARRRAWAENERIRTEGSTAVADAALAAGVNQLIQESLGFAYPDRGAEWIDEATPLEVVPTNQGVLVAEANAARVTRAGATGVVLRFGNFYGPDASHTQSTVQAARLGIAAMMGPDDAYWPSIHLDDAADAVVLALGAPAGVYNVADEPVTRRAYAQALAAALDRPRLRKPPTALGKLGGEAASSLLRSVRPTSAKFVETTGWKRAYPSVREGWPAVVRAMAGDSPREEA